MRQRQPLGIPVTTFTESTVETAALAWLESLGWHIAHGSAIAWYTRPA